MVQPSLVLLAVQNCFFFPKQTITDRLKEVYPAEFSLPHLPGNTQGSTPLAWSKSQCGAALSQAEPLSRNAALSSPGPPSPNPRNQCLLQAPALTLQSHILARSGGWVVKGEWGRAGRDSRLALHRDLMEMFTFGLEGRLEPVPLSRFAGNLHQVMDTAPGSKWLEEGGFTAFSLLALMDPGGLRKGWMCSQPC